MTKILAKLETMEAEILGREPVWSILSIFYHINPKFLNILGKNLELKNVETLIR
jgi:hypothetical protein